MQTESNNTIKRLKAFAVDYCIILIYIGLLFGITLLISKIFSVSLQNVGAVSGQLIGFATLTLPVILYFTLFENSKHAGTLGKRMFDLEVVSKNLSKASFGQLLIRNCVKFLPWELAHFFVFRLFDSGRNNASPQDWVLAGLIISQGLVVIYLLFLFLNINNRSLYELLSSTLVRTKYGQLQREF